MIRLAASYTTNIASMAYDLVGDTCESCNEAPVFPTVGKIPRGHRIENCGIWEKKRTRGGVDEYILSANTDFAHIVPIADQAQNTFGNGLATGGCDGGPIPALYRLRHSGYARCLGHLVCQQKYRERQ
ncbi:hypothetical protein LJR255_004873 [Pararhizobium sp. LjRoot255]|uniref:hypothetical protein n=1 Tax=Pararhizobium sp. LjRoot255 TaxID=3342298 RepID=UPI003ECD821F